MTRSAHAASCIGDWPRAHQEPLVADLIAQGADPQHRWRRTLLADRPVTLGRAPNCWPTSWDDRVSRQHAEIRWDGQRLKVRQLPGARNPIFVKGRPATDFDIAPGEHFVIGETTFTLTDERVNVSLDVPQPVQQQTFSSQYLQKMQFRHTGAHIDVLGRLPEVISGASSDSELSVRLVNLLLTGVAAGRRRGAGGGQASRRTSGPRSKCCTGTGGW